MENELRKLAEEVGIIRDVLSKQGGELEAMQQALRGILFEVSLDSRQRQAVEGCLELTYSRLLQRGVNAAFQAGFESVAEQLLECLQKPPTGCTARSGHL